MRRARLFPIQLEASAFPIGSRVEMAPEFVAMGWPNVGTLESFCSSETSQYLVRFDDGSCRKVVRASIAGPAPAIVPRTPGQLAYEADCAVRPNYHTGEPRKSWADLGAVERWSWERNPTRREG